MALLSNRKTTTDLASASEPFRVPSLAEVDPEYAALQLRQGELQNALNALEHARVSVRHDLASDRSPAVRPGVAVLLGDDAVESRSAKATRLAEIRRSIADHEAAIVAIRGRIAAANGRASKTVREAVRPEYSRRVVAVVDALKAVESARADYENLRSRLEAENVEWTALVPVSLGFLGDLHLGKSSQVQRVIKDSNEAGYV